MKKLNELDRGLVMLLGLTTFAGSVLAQSIVGYNQSNKDIARLTEEKTAQIEVIKQSDVYKDAIEKLPEFDIDNVEAGYSIISDAKVEETNKKIDKEISDKEWYKGYYKAGIGLSAGVTGLFALATGLAIYGTVKEEKENAEKDIDQDQDQDM